jgi:hypothetical protein
MGIDELCDRIIGGESQTEIARDIKVSVATLVGWISSDPERSARAREARIASASSFADKAAEELQSANDVFGLAKARELASHWRWRASKTIPREYGDKIEIDQRTTITDLTDEQLDEKLTRLLAQG